MPVRRVAVVAVAAASLALGGAVTDASSADDSPKPQHSRVAKKPTTRAPAAGLIVQTKTTRSADHLRAAARSAVQGRASVASARRLSGRMSVVRFSSRVSRDDALAAAKAMEARSDVEWAIPDTVFRPATNPPVTTNDTYYKNLQHLWDRRGPSSALSTPWPSGGYSTHAPSLWRATSGSPSVVVAVLDTGITNHKDFNTQRVSGGGYDFLSGPSSETRDGGGWDPNPADPGDWQTTNDCEEEHPAFNSSWHGTHVTGILAAKANNSMGVAGVAPGVKIAPVRVMGRCGGVESDVIAALTWATGSHVEGVPDNPVANRAKVVNMSLGQDYETTAEAARQCLAFAPALSAARSRGATVVVAAGNSRHDARRSVPAACPGVVTVGATYSLGYGASYSNFGPALTLSAAGGDVDAVGPGAGILSTYNRGVTVPGTATYTRIEGTSMATPMVSAAAALLYSAGMKTTAQVEQGLRSAVQRFPDFAPEVGVYNCRGATVYSCGAGVLDLGKVQAILKGKRPTITGTWKVGARISTGTGYGQWNNSNAGFTFQWLRNGSAISGATSRTYTVTSADVGKRLKVKVTPKITAFAPLYHTSYSSGIIKR
jgi:serine protease